MTGEWPPDEQILLKKWTAQHYSDELYFTEVPVEIEQPPNWYEIGSPKLVDLVLFPDPPGPIKEQIKRHAIQTGEGVRFESTNTGPEVKIDQLRYFVALLKTGPDKHLPVRVYEVKQHLNFQALGQIITYTDHFPQYYDIGGTQPEIIERGIIHAQTDPIIEETADTYGIELYNIDSPE